MRKAALLALLFVCACGSAGPGSQSVATTTPVAMASPSASPAGFAEQTPAVSPQPTSKPAPRPTPAAPTIPKPVALACSSSIPTGANLALVTLRGSANVAVRDLTDMRNPVTRCTFASCIQSCVSFGPTDIRFADASHVSYTVNDGGGGVALYLANLQTRETTLILGAVAHALSIAAYAWTPDGNALAYLAPTDTSIALHQLSGGSNRVLASVPALPAVGCEQQCVGEDTWDISLLYSPDGSMLSLTDSIVDSHFRVWTADGKQLDKDDAETRSMSVWAGTGLFFNGPKGVVVWRNGTVTTFIPGTRWIRPKASPDGTQIVFGTRDASGWVHTVIAEPSTGKTFEIKKARSEPIFLTSRYLWYGGERACVAADNCAAFPTTSSGTTYVYDLLNATETASVITGVADVWPHQGTVS